MDLFVDLVVGRVNHGNLLLGAPDGGFWVWCRLSGLSGSVRSRLHRQAAARSLTVRVRRRRRRRATNWCRWDGAGLLVAAGGQGSRFPGGARPGDGTELAGRGVGGAVLLPGGRRGGGRTGA